MKHRRGTSHGASSPLLWHTVSFYDDASAHVRSLQDLVRTGLDAGHAVIIIATQPHRDGIDLGLGPRHAQAVADGALVMLDAEETLASFTVGGRVNRRLFRERVGSLIQDCLQRFPAVDAYGEMVALLWDRDEVEAALELETMWNGLHRSLPFKLHCAYPVPDASLHPLLSPHAPACSLHNAVI
ncbi:MAG: hypothetical protein QOE64_2442 [Frankiales bacterium]|nr:hypothetical protein [Frankiales bacterium]